MRKKLSENITKQYEYNMEIHIIKNKWIYIFIYILYICTHSHVCPHRHLYISAVEGNQS